MTVGKAERFVILDLNDRVTEERDTDAVGIAVEETVDVEEGTTKGDDT